MNGNREEWGEENIVQEVRHATGMSAELLAGPLVEVAEQFAAGAPNMTI